MLKVSREEMRIFRNQVHVYLSIPCPDLYHLKYTNECIRNASTSANEKLYKVART